MHKILIITLGITSIITLTTPMAFSRPISSDAACDRALEACIRNANKCSDPYKCENRCIAKETACKAGLPIPGGGKPPQRATLDNGGGAMKDFPAPGNGTNSGSNTNAGATPSVPGDSKKSGVAVSGPTTTGGASGGSSLPTAGANASFGSGSLKTIQQLRNQRAN